MRVSSSSSHGLPLSSCFSTGSVMWMSKRSVDV
uniref:Uncharacterized protein n=1 Tax=Arundo donax TaxID=35708 RepID=A0A0A8ZMT0_ARUDO